MPNDESLDVLIVGGGPAGLSAALALGRGLKRVLLCDGGPRRNAAAAHVHNFVTRDGVEPAEFRRIGRAQLSPYPSVRVRDVGVTHVSGERGAFRVELDDGMVSARRILLCTGMIDVLPELSGFRALWGKAIFQCPYCHGYEVRQRKFGVLASQVELLEFGLVLRSWTRDVVVFTEGRFAVPPDARARLAKAGIELDERVLSNITSRGDAIDAVHFTEGEPRALDVLFARPPQRQVPIVSSLGLALDDHGYVKVHELHRETSRPGIYAAGDLTTFMQAALFAAHAGLQAAAMLNHELTVELALAGDLP